MNFKIGIIIIARVQGRNEETKASSEISKTRKMLKRTQKFFAAPAGVSLGHWTATWCSNTLFLASQTANPEKERQTQRTE